MVHRGRHYLRRMIFGEHVERAIQRAQSNTRKAELEDIMIGGSQEVSQENEKKGGCDHNEFTI